MGKRKKKIGKLRLYKGDIVYRGDRMHWGKSIGDLIVVIDKTEVKTDPSDWADWEIFHSPLRNRIKRMLKI